MSASKPRGFPFVTEFIDPTFLFGILFLIFCGFWNSLSQIYVERFNASYHIEGGGTKESRPHDALLTLPDIGFHLLPHLSNPDLPDNWGIFVASCTLIPVILFHRRRLAILKRYMFIQGIVFLLRGITIAVTLLPNPFKNCVSQTSPNEWAFVEAIKVMFGIRITCGDVLFSGHAANLTLMALIWREYSRTFLPRRLYRPVLHTVSSVQTLKSTAKITYGAISLFFRCLPWFWIAMAVIGELIIVATHFHYTVDVVVGTVVSLSIWFLYHMIVRTPRILAKAPLLMWYEACSRTKLNMQNNNNFLGSDNLSGTEDNVDIDNKPMRVISSNASTIDEVYYTYNLGEDA